MQALRVGKTLTRVTKSSSLASSFSTSSRKFDHHHAPAATASGGLGESIIPVGNIQAQWEQMTESEQALVHRQLEELQKKDWKSLGSDEKRAAYYISFGPHGTRVPVNKPGEVNRIVLGVLGLMAATTVVWVTVKGFAAPPPKTLTKEWQEASNEKAKEQKMNPITGIGSEGYKGKGFVQNN